VTPVAGLGDGSSIGGRWFKERFGRVLSLLNISGRPRAARGALWAMSVIIYRA
jgi:hypothetical protein